MPKILHNFNLQKELDERSGLDWQFGASSVPALVSIPLSERDQYLPMGETQFDQFVDFTDCASRSPVNHLEAIFTYHYQHAMLPENKTWFDDNGYVQNSKITFSHRYIAVLSGTTHDGNSLKAPIEAIRTQGLIPNKLLPKEDWMQWADYYDASKITPELKALGQEFLKRFTINYEQVTNGYFAGSLKNDMIGVAGFAWNPPDPNNIYHSDSTQFNHAFLLYNLPAYEAFDNYIANNTFTKNLSPDYKFFDWGYRVYVANENVPQTVISLYQQVANILKALVAWLESPKQPATPSPVVIANPVQVNGFAWNNVQNARHSVRVICDSAGLTPEQKDTICRVIRAESGFNNNAVNYNKNASGQITSIDYGLCQINSWYHIGKGKDFPSVQYVLDHPHEAVAWMIKLFKEGHLNWWSSYASGAYLKYSP